MSLLDIPFAAPNPIEVVERVASTHDWSFERSGEDEVTIVVQGQWDEYQAAFTWMHDLEALHLACAFDMKIPPARLAEVQRLVALINEQMWVGHFDMWRGNALIMFRHALVLPGGVEASNAQCETMLATALESCERYYPAFQYVVWAGYSAQAALDAVMFDTAGEA